MFDVARRKGLRRPCFGADRIGLPVRSRCDRRCAFRAAVAAARLFYSLPRGPAHPGFPDRRGSAGKLASCRAHQGARRHAGDGEAELDLVEDLAAFSAKLDLRRSHRRRADRREVARRRPYELHSKPHVAAQSPEGGRRNRKRPQKWLAPCTGAPAPTKTGSSASAPRFVSTMWRAAFARRRAARRVRSSWWLKATTVRSRLLSPREAARLMGLDDDYRLPSAITTPTMSVATAYARRSCGISPDMFLNLSSLITRGRSSSRRSRMDVWWAACVRRSGPSRIRQRRRLIGAS